MSTQSPPAASSVTIPTLPQRHAFGWPPGSIRAILLLLVVALVCALLLATRTRDGERIIPIPPALFYLLFVGIGYYFGARTHGPEVHKDQPPPLWLPTGSVRFIIMGALTATVVWKLIHDEAGLKSQLEESAKTL